MAAMHKQLIDTHHRVMIHAVKGQGNALAGQFRCEGKRLLILHGAAGIEGAGIFGGIVRAGIIADVVVMGKIDLPGRAGEMPFFRVRGGVSHPGSVEINDHRESLFLRYVSNRMNAAWVS